MAKKIILLSLATAAVLGLLAMAETAARAWARSRGDQLDRTVLILQPDRLLGWRQRPGLDEEFMGARVRTNSLGLRALELPPPGVKGRLNVLVLGPSSAFGWGEEEQNSYPAILQEELSRFPDFGKAAVINAAQIGYSSLQGALFYKQVIRPVFKPGMVVIAYGANDVDRFRFFYPDGGPDSAVLGKEGESLRGKAERLTARLIFPHLLRRLLTAGMLAAKPRAAAAPRVGGEEFRANIEELVRLAREDGATPILLTTAHSFRKGELPGMPGFRPAEEIAGLNSIMEQVSKSSSVRLVDAEAALTPLAPEEVFIDPVHFSKRGAALIAAALRKAAVSCAAREEKHGTVTN